MSQPTLTHDTVALAGSAVAISRRSNRQRLIGAVGIGLAAAAGVAVMFLLRPLSHDAGSPSHSAPAQTFNVFSISNGMSEREVLRIAGQPTTRQGPCWIYRTNQLAPSGDRIDALKICFYVGYAYNRNFNVNASWLQRPTIAVP